MPCALRGHHLPRLGAPRTHGSDSAPRGAARSARLDRTARTRAANTAACGTARASGRLASLASRKDAPAAAGGAGGAWRDRGEPGGSGRMQGAGMRRQPRTPSGDSTLMQGKRGVPLFSLSSNRSPPRCPERAPSKAVLSLTHLQPHGGEGSRRPLSAERPQRSPERPARPCERTGQEKERGGSSRRSGTAGRFARAHRAAAAEAPPAGSALCSSSGASFFPVLFRKRGTGTGCISCSSLNIKTKHLKTKRFALQINRELEPSHGEVGLRLSWFGFISVMVLCVGVLIVFCFSLKALYKPNVTPHRIVLGVTGRDNNYPVQRSYPHMARSNKYLV